MDRLDAEKLMVRLCRCRCRRRRGRRRLLFRLRDRIVVVGVGGVRVYLVILSEIADCDSFD